MLAVATLATILVFAAGMTPWRGGTFGMFSSVDTRSTRQVLAYTEVDGRSIQLDLSSYQAQLDELRILPTEGRLTRFLKGTVCAVAPPAASSVSLRYLKLEIDRVQVTPVEVWRGETDDC